MQRYIAEPLGSLLGAELSRSLTKVGKKVTLPCSMVVKTYGGAGVSRRRRALYQKSLTLKCWVRIIGFAVLLSTSKFRVSLKNLPM